MKLTEKKWSIIYLVMICVLLACVGGFVVFVDPYFHYHKPLDGLAYAINNQRYQNDGIVRHFDYDAIITGTSMTENFKASEFDSIFGVHSVKVPFSGGSYKEINDNLKVAVENNDGIKVILRGLDYNSLLVPANHMRYDEDNYPRYLYDDYYYNDVRYIWNKSLVVQSLGTLIRTAKGGKMTDFDTYSNWNSSHKFGRDAVLESYDRTEKALETAEFTEEDRSIVRETITQNVTSLAMDHPEIDFYLFFTPYSIYYWDSLNQSGTMQRQLDAERYAIELLLQCDNIHLFSFFSNHSMVCNLYNYKDTGHYGQNVNSRMLKWMHGGEYELTEENYQEYCDGMREYYLNYDYESLFPQ